MQITDHELVLIRKALAGKQNLVARAKLRASAQENIELARSLMGRWHEDQP